MPMLEKDGARQFYALKAELVSAILGAENGNFSTFDPKAYEPGAFRANRTVTGSIKKHPMHEIGAVDGAD